MKIMLHGATSGSNFGDILFADLFYKNIQQINPYGENIFFEMSVFGASEFLKSELNINDKMTIKDIFTSDALILISGGYFGERSKTFKENLIRFIRYVPLGLLFILRKKPILISGVGGGPLSNKLLRKSMTFLMDKAHVVTVRDEETKKYFKKYGVKNDIKETSDTAQIISVDSLPPLEKKELQSINDIFESKKIILLHLYGKEEIDNLIFKNVVPSLNEFLEKNTDYGVIVSTDFEFDLSVYEIKNKFSKSARIYIYNYKKVWQMCALINRVDVIITPKLHVGILGSTFSKSVISVPMHIEKTARYYKQINQPDRCISLDEVNPEIVSSMLEKYKTDKIVLPNHIRLKSSENLKFLEKYLSNQINIDF